MRDPETVDALWNVSKTDGWQPVDFIVELRYLLSGLGGGEALSGFIE